MPRSFWAKATRFSISESSRKPLLSLSAWRRARSLLQAVSQPRPRPRRRSASRSSFRLILPSPSASNCFSHSLNSSSVMSSSRVEATPRIAMAGAAGSSS
uniref:Uncharacterized protein n=1 Tax=Zea mays TaxID=4577 RepID=A0A804MT22_MAIZE